jgi:hypothetical protein
VFAIGETGKFHVYEIAAAFTGDPGGKDLGILGADDLHPILPHAEST